MMNIFEIIEKVTRRIEPFHSEFLTRILSSDKKLLNKFFQLIHTTENSTSIEQFMLSEEVVIQSEDVLCDSRRIDLIIKEQNSKNIIGVEIKTSDTSVRDKQLATYHENMLQKYPGYKVIFVFLTPFNQHNLPSDIAEGLIKAINEFTNFHKIMKNSIHINWDDIINLYDNTNVLLNNHQDYIKTRITNKLHLKKRIKNVERNRSLSEFFGDEFVNEFYDTLTKNNISYCENDEKIKFDIAKNNSNHSELIDAFRILMDSDNLRKKDSRQNKVKMELLQRYEQGINGIFFKDFFYIINKYTYIWLQGENRIGIRASHNSHRSAGVSIFTIDKHNVILYKKR